MHLRGTTHVRDAIITTRTYIALSCRAPHLLNQPKWPFPTEAPVLKFIFMPFVSCFQPVTRLSFTVAKRLLTHLHRIAHCTYMISEKSSNPLSGKERIVFYLVADGRLRAVPREDQSLRIEL